MSVGEFNLVFAHCSLHDVEIVRTYLMSESAGSAVDHDGDLPWFVHAKSFGCFSIVDFVYFLNFEEMVA